MQITPPSIEPTNLAISPGTEMERFDARTPIFPRSIPSRRSTGSNPQQRVGRSLACDKIASRERGMNEVAVSGVVADTFDLEIRFPDMPRL
jgi:hypothetical protein